MERPVGNQRAGNGGVTGSVRSAALANPSRLCGAIIGEKSHNRSRGALDPDVARTTHVHPLRDEDDGHVETLRLEERVRVTASRVNDQNLRFHVLYQHRTNRCGERCARPV